MKNWATALLIGFTLFATRATAEELSCCSGCGCRCCLKPVCRLVCEMKEVKETVYDCKCEDFCVPGPSEHCGKQCECDCQSPHGKSCHILWKPTCGKVHSRHILTKHDVVKKVPTYRCEVVYVCDKCCGHGGCCASVGPQASLPEAAIEAPVPPPSVAPPTAKIASPKKSMFLTSIFKK